MEGARPDRRPRKPLSNATEASWSHPAKHKLPMDSRAAGTQIDGSETQKWKAESARLWTREPASNATLESRAQRWKQDRQTSSTERGMFIERMPTHRACGIATPARMRCWTAGDKPRTLTLTGGQPMAESRTRKTRAVQSSEVATPARMRFWTGRCSTRRSFRRLPRRRRGCRVRNRLYPVPARRCPRRDRAVGQAQRAISGPKPGAASRVRM